MPVCPQLMLSAFLDESRERDTALMLCAELLRCCDEVRVYGAEITPGMHLEIGLARALSIPVVFMDPMAEVA